MTIIVWYCYALVITYMYIMLHGCCFCRWSMKVWYHIYMTSNGSVCVFVFSYRQQLSTVERSRQKFKAAPLTVEFVPFFYRKSLSGWTLFLWAVWFVCLQIRSSDNSSIIWPSAIAQNSSLHVSVVYLIIVFVKPVAGSVSLTLAL